MNPAFTRDAKGEWITRRDLLIHGMTLAQVQTYDVGRLNPADPYAKAFPGQQARDGQRNPTLAALFKLVNDLGATHIQFHIETKINPTLPSNSPTPEAFGSSARGHGAKGTGIAQGCHAIGLFKFVLALVCIE